MVEVEVGVAVSGAAATARMAVMEEAVKDDAVVWVAARQRLRRARRADREAAPDDGDEGSSWDRCGCCMAAQPAPRRAHQ